MYPAPGGVHFRPTARRAGRARLRAASRRKTNAHISAPARGHGGHGARPHHARRPRRGRARPGGAGRLPSGLLLRVEDGRRHRHHVQDERQRRDARHLGQPVPHGLQPDHKVRVPPRRRELRLRRRPRLRRPQPLGHRVGRPRQQQRQLRPPGRHRARVRRLGALPLLVREPAGHRARLRRPERRQVVRRPLPRPVRPPLVPPRQRHRQAARWRLGRDERPHPARRLLRRRQGGRDRPRGVHRQAAP